MPNSQHHPENEESGSRGSINLGVRLGDIETVLEEIRDQIEAGARVFAVMGIRIRALEIIVYGGCGIVLIAVLTAVLVLVVKSAEPVIVQTVPTTKTGATP